MHIYMNIHIYMYIYISIHIYMYINIIIYIYMYYLFLHDMSHSYKRHDSFK